MTPVCSSLGGRSDPSLRANLYTSFPHKTTEKNKWWKQGILLVASLFQNFQWWGYFMFFCFFLCFSRSKLYFYSLTNPWEKRVLEYHIGIESSKFQSNYQKMKKKRKANSNPPTLPMNLIFLLSFVSSSFFGKSSSLLLFYLVW